MSTRCLIARENRNGVIRGIYCHSDGYPDGVGSVLDRHYTSARSIDRLIRCGDISSLGPTPTRGTQVKDYDPRFGPDGDDAPFECADGDIIAASRHDDVAWVYLRKGGTWLVARNTCGTGLGAFEPLAPKIDRRRELKARQASDECEGRLRINLMLALADVNRKTLPLSASDVASLNEKFERQLTGVGYLKDGKLTERGLDAAWAVMERYQMTSGIEAEGPLDNR